MIIYIIMYAKKIRKRVVRKAKPVAKSTKKYVKRVLDKARENKYFDLSQTIAAGTAATNNSGSIVLLSGIQQGTAFNQRIGEVVNPKSLEVRFDVNPSLNNSGFTNFRVIIFQDKQIRTSTLPVVADVLETVAFNSPYNHIFLNANRFHILLDKWMELDPYYVNQASAMSAITTGTSASFHKKFKLTSKICYTDSTTGTERGNIYILYLSDIATASAPAVRCYSRLIYEDA